MDLFFENSWWLTDFSGNFHYINGFFLKFNRFFLNPWIFPIFNCFSGKIFRVYQIGFYNVPKVNCFSLKDPSFKAATNKEQVRNYRLIIATVSKYRSAFVSFYEVSFGHRYLISSIKNYQNKKLSAILRHRYFVWYRSSLLLSIDFYNAPKVDWFSLKGPSFWAAINKELVQDIEV